MSNPSNLYAEKIFSEHPISLWALDDKVDYFSLITEEQKDLETWTIDSEHTGAIAQVTSLNTQPFPTDSLFELTGNPSTTNIKYTMITSNDILNLQDLNENMKTISIGSYFYSKSTHIDSIEIGYEYTDVLSGLNVQKSKLVPIEIDNKWLFLSETFETPIQNTSLRLFIKIGYRPSTDSSSAYKFLINGLSLGQWSEEFNSYSLGSTFIDLPSTIALETCKVVKADPYGPDENFGYYLSSSNSLVCRNMGVPLVYGASNVTLITENKNQDGSPKPSLIIPGNGFLNEIGRYKEYTVEMWMNITSDAVESKRIFGPIASNDGLYIDGAFLTLVINENFSSSYVGEWCRPMLIQVTYSEGFAEVILNGEVIISMLIDNDSIILPKQINSNKEQDWLGFYAYEDISPIEIDCVAIYPYKVPEDLAKKRWVYGQAVPSTENINSSYNGSIASIDYAFSGYSSDYSYPNIGRWSQGTFDNLITDGRFLMNPDYKLPELYIKNFTESQVFNACKTLQPVGETENNGETNKFFTFKPSSEINANGSLRFENFNILLEEIQTIWAVVKVKTLPITEQTVIFIKNKLNLDYFSVTIDSSKVYYKIKVNGILQTLYSEDYTINTEISVGFNIKQLILSFGDNLSSFFGNRNYLDFILLNNDLMNSCFNGYVYKVGIETDKNTKTITTHINDNGTIDQETNLINSTASYTLLPETQYNKYYLDIAVTGYWEDYIPLKYFSKYITDSSGNEKYDFDYLQFNINFPSPSKFRTLTETDSWTYGELDAEFATPVQQQYDVLDNSLFTGYDNYEDLQKNRSKFGYQYDTIKSAVRTYLSFQIIKTGISTDLDYFTSIAPALKNGLMDVEYVGNWYTTKYEVVNDTIVYPPQSIDIDSLAVVIHVEFKLPGIISKQVKIKSLELASQALNESFPTEIGTKTGTKLYPYKKDGVYFDYKYKNPISIYKKSNPYLYLTRSSGVQVKGDYSPLINRGVSLPINENGSASFAVNTMQIAFRYDEGFFPITPYQIFEINSANSLIKFYMVSNSSGGDRAKIYAINSKTGKLENGISYYLNGNLVSNPVINIKQWNFIGILFSEVLSFDSYIGYIGLNGPLLFNHISYYKISSLQQKQSSSLRLWNDVKEQFVQGSEDPLIFDWQYWETAFLWYGVLVRSTSYTYGTTPSDIYKAYMGTNKIITGGEGEKTAMVSMDPITFYSDSLWKQYVATPV